MLTDGDYHIYFAPFAGSIKALVTLGEDNYYSIYVNSNLPHEVQREAIKHELRHIMRDDFFNSNSIQEVEEG